MSVRHLLPIENGRRKTEKQAATEECTSCASGRLVSGLVGPGSVGSVSTEQAGDPCVSRRARARRRRRRRPLEGMAQDCNAARSLERPAFYPFTGEMLDFSPRICWAQSEAKSGLSSEPTSY